MSNNGSLPKLDLVDPENENYQEQRLSPYRSKNSPLSIKDSKGKVLRNQQSDIDNLDDAIYELQNRLSPRMVKSKFSK